MLFLVPDPTYPEHEDRSEEFRSSLASEVAKDLGGSAVLHEVDAGPSASIPAFFLEIVPPVADGIALFAGPMVIAEGFKWWKRNFVRGAEFLKAKGLAYSVDPASAALLAIENAADLTGGPEDLQVISVTRHWMNLNGPGSDHREWDEQRESLEDDSHTQAVRQLDVRYIILLRSGERHFTAVVEKDGAVSGLHPFRL